jgi:hypothetical protein
MEQNESRPTNFSADSNKVKVKFSQCLPKHQTMKMHPLLSLVSHRAYVLGEWSYSSTHS